MVGVASTVVVWRRTRTARRELPSDFKLFPSGKPAAIPEGPLTFIDAQSALLVTENPPEEDAWTYMSTARVEKLWVFNTKTQKFDFSQLFREELLVQGRVDALDTEVRQFFAKINFDCTQLQDLRFIKIPGMTEKEQMAVVCFSPGNSLIILFSDRVTLTYQWWIREAAAQIAEIFNGSLKVDNKRVLEIFEDHLHISRSLPHVQSTAETDEILQSTWIPGLDAETEIFQDARGFTTEECQWFVDKIEQLRVTCEADPQLDGEEE